MVQKYNTSGFDAPVVGDYGDVIFAGVINGIETALTHDAGTGDPSSGAAVAWGANDVGRFWCDRTDADNPVWKVWQQIAAGPTYGWRTMRLRKTKWLTAPETVTFSPASPAAADVAATDVDLSTLLDDGGSGDVQDASQLVSKVVGVWLRIRVRTGASETITAATDHAYFQVNQNGGTVVQRIYCQVANRYMEATVFVPLDTDEIFEFLVKVGGGTAAFEYEAWVIGFQEAF